MEKTEARPISRARLFPCRPTASARGAALVRDGAAQPGPVPGKHGTLDDCITRLPEIAALGFDVIYLTPIHPVGRTNRKGRTIRSTPGPTIPAASTRSAASTAAMTRWSRSWARSRTSAGAGRCRRKHKMEIALDFAVQCSLDHPWLKQHPEWFRFRPDGSIRFAENPPKKYEDIVNPDFNCADRIALWDALRKVVLFWVEQGVRIFRVDNPHTKPFPFWEWLIREVRTNHPDVIFLSEAFTRPKVMKALAKIGFSQSYTFTWRTVGAGLSGEIRAIPSAVFPANFFVTTPDILPVRCSPASHGVQVARGADGDAVIELRHLQRIRAARARADPLPRGIPQLGKIRDQDARLEHAWQHQGLSRPAQRDPARQRRAAADGQPAVPADR
jgi:starch synthase (maltosyl-transferring)